MLPPKAEAYLVYATVLRHLLLVRVCLAASVELHLTTRTSGFVRRGRWCQEHLALSAVVDYDILAGGGVGAGRNNEFTIVVNC